MLYEHELKAQRWYDTLKTIKRDEQKAWIKKTLRPKSMLHVFGRYFFQHFIHGRTPECHIELIEELSKPESSAIIFPRGFAKSTWEKIDTLHDIVYGIEPVIVYISVTLQDAGFHFESMKVELENNESLRYVYGDLVPSQAAKSVKWTNTHFETTNHVNLIARGANKGRGVNIKNQRPTKIVGDDCENDEQVRSPMRRQKYHDWLYNVMIPSLDKERGRMKIIGTVIHPECEVLKFYEQHGGMFKKAIENIDGDISTGESIWPTYWTMEDLLAKKQEIGTRAFMQEFMQEPTNMELARISHEWLDDNIFTVLPENTKNTLTIVITIDPQSGEKSQADEYAITVLGYYKKDPHRYVLEQVAGRASQLQQAAEVVRVWQRYPTAKVVGIEKLLTQVAVFQLLNEWRSGTIELEGVSIDDRNIPIQAITPGGKDKVTRFEKHEPAIERGELHLRPEMHILREQILFLGTGVLDHDDRVDSLIMALSLSYQNALSTDSDLLTTKTPGITAGVMRKQF